MVQITQSFKFNRQEGDGVRCQRGLLTIVRRQRFVHLKHPPAHTHTYLCTCNKKLPRWHCKIFEHIIFSASRRTQIYSHMCAHINISHLNTVAQINCNGLTHFNSLNGTAHAHTFQLHITSTNSLPPKFLTPVGSGSSEVRVGTSKSTVTRFKPRSTSLVSPLACNFH